MYLIALARSRRFYGLLTHSLTVPCYGEACSRVLRDGIRAREPGGMELNCVKIPFSRSQCCFVISTFRGYFVLLGPLGVGDMSSRERPCPTGTKVAPIAL